MIVVLGGSGYVGSSIVNLLSSQGQDVRVLSRKDCNYYDPASLGEAVGNASFLINAAGYTGRPNVDACEQHKHECLMGNAVLPGVVKEVCESKKLPWVQISSGCIYTGTREDGSGFTESDPPNFSFRYDNCSFYSGTKALGEEVLADAEQCYVLRLRIPFENLDNPRNYLTKLLRYQRLLRATNSLTFLDEFAKSCLYCAESRPEPGIYNVTNTGCVTTDEVVERLKSHGITDKEFEFFDSEEEFMQKAAIAPRSNCVMNNEKAIAAGFPLSYVHDALDLAMSNWISEETSATK
ncbi:NAD-dependent epimerase/dehydratase family protein [Bremerella cremea]|uniref:dTDP-4-dehydrorhamnose reductase n=1 Tax=Bremerella cremea TaxID=1031537 RepID=A0A368KPE6_9BACT|nr:sugar nucleotide-binding protein [Bremerella cremea]RCS46360.1 NAD-dependent epimerase/dehydratase family protein [Bremerella cremea]